MIFGPDVSHYQAGIDLKRAASEGLQFILAKVSQGAASHDPAWPANRDNAHAAGLLLCGYHYVTTDAPAKQAANCKAALGDTSIPLALDWEANGGNWANFMAVLNAFRAAGLNVRLAYCPRWYWQQQGSPNMAAAALPLWSSRYPSTGSGSPSSLYNHVPANYWDGYGGLDVGLLQFSDHASIAGMSTDCSAYRGNRDQLAALLGITSNTPEDDMTDDERLMLKDIHDALPMLKDMWSQLAGSGAKPGEFTGWPGLPGGTQETLTLVDWCRQNDVSLNEIKEKVGA